MVKDEREENWCGPAPEEQQIEWNTGISRQWYREGCNNQFADDQVDRHRTRKVSLFALIKEATIRAPFIHFERLAKQLSPATNGTAQQKAP